MTGHEKGLRKPAIRDVFDGAGVTVADVQDATAAKLNTDGVKVMDL
jgi:hypothetical protein